MNVLRRSGLLSWFLVPPPLLETPLHLWKLMWFGVEKEENSRKAKTKVIKASQPQRGKENKGKGKNFCNDYQKGKFGELKGNSKGGQRPQRQRKELP